MRSRKVLCLFATVAIFFSLSTAAFAIEEAQMLEFADMYGALTLLPPIVTIVCALCAKNVLFSLAFGGFTGAIMLNLGGGNIFKTIYDSFFYFTNMIISVLTDRWNAGIILQCFTIMALVAVVSRMGGARAIAVWISKFARTPRSTQIVTWIIGILIFFDDYANLMIVGPIMRPIADSQSISREKQAFIIDSTAAPVAGLAFISTWIATELGAIKQGFEGAGIVAEPYSFFLATIPYRFYNILMLFFVVLSAAWLRDFGKMYQAEYRARTTDMLIAPDAKPMVSAESVNYEPKEGIKLSVWDAIIPIGTLIFASVMGFYLNGYNAIIATGNAESITTLTNNRWSFVAIREAISYADASVVLFEVAIFSTIIAAFMGILKKKLTLTEVFDAWVEGLKSVLMACIILTLSWTLSSFVRELGTRFFLADFVGAWMPAFLLPTTIFTLGSIISFATGTSYGTMSILMPLAIPLAFDMNPDMTFVTICAGAVLTGSILGDHCSPISDTTILSSTGAASDHIHHFRTQFQYALTVGVVSIVCGFIPVTLGIHPLLCLLIGMFVLVAIMQIFGKSTNIKRNNSTT